MQGGSGTTTQILTFLFLLPCAGFTSPVLRTRPAETKLPVFWRFAAGMMIVLAIFGGSES